MAAPKAQLEKRAPAQRQIPIELIRVRKEHNFRQDFDEEDLQGLAQSIAKHGILQPLTVRYLNTHKGSTVDLAYELVAGERRLRAAKIAKLKVVPAVALELTDAEADEIMVIENLQRKDLNDLEYAEGFTRLIKTHGYSVEDLAKKVGKGPTFIRELLHMAKLPNCAREGLLSERISKSVAVLIATIPDEGQREKFAKEVLRGNTHGSWDRGNALTYREAKDWKEQTYMKVLSGSPFPLDKQIDPAWPHSCKTCPHFAGNTNGSAQQGKRSDVCLNPPHYQHLTQLHAKSQLKAIEAEGKQVLTSAETEKIFYQGGDGRFHHSSHQDQKYVDLSDDFTDYGKNHQRVSWGSVVKKDKLDILFAVTPDGVVHKLALKKDAEASAKKQGHKLTYGSSTSSRSIAPAQPRVSDEKRKAIAASREVAVRAAVQKALDTKWTKASLNAWRELLTWAIQMTGMGDGGDEFLALVVGAEKPKKGARGSYDFYEKFLQKHVTSLRTVEAMQSMLAALLTADRLSNCTGEYAIDFSKEDLSLCKALGVDVKKIERDELAKLESANKVEKSAKKRPAKRAAK